MHLPLAAVLVLLVLALHVLAERLAAPRALRLGVLAALVLALGAGTVRRNRDYRSELALWQQTVAVRPDNAGARNNLGRALARLGRFEEAAAEFARALELPDAPPDALVNLGNVLTDLGQLADADAHFAEVLRLDPASVKAREGLASVRMRQERWAEAVELYRACVAAGHRSADLHSNLGKALYKLGRGDEAIAEMRAALALDPRHAVAAGNLKIVLERERDKPR
jgi:Tfp pilus assembly protein PilF